MIALEEIHQLPLRDKLLLLEAIWDDISRQEQDLEVPQWHKELVDERERLLADGKAKFVDWEQAKRQINEAILDSAPSQRGLTGALQAGAGLRFG
jgi:hypothetical protein